MKQKTYAKLSIILIIIVALIRFIFALTHTVSGDACWQLSAARFIADNNQIPLFEGIGRAQPFWPPPLFHLFGASLFKIFSLVSRDVADISLKLVSPIFGTLTIIITYLITRRLFNEKITFYSMIFINFIPVFLDYSILGYVGSTSAFFSVFSVYLMINKKYFLSSISLGMATLSKYNAIFMLPMILYLAYKFINKKERNRAVLIVLFIPLLLSSIWFLRNLILLGNPVWPFLNGLFRGITIGTTFNSISLSNIFSFDNYLRWYLELFGVPNGNISLITFYNGVLIKYLFLIWLLSTLFFIYPLIKGFFVTIVIDKEKKYFLKSIYILVSSYFLMLFIYLININWFSPRLLLPIMPFIGIVWARGFSSIKKQRVYLLIVLLISTGFIVTEAVKVVTAAKEWSLYNQDFEWVKKNTKQNDLFYGNGQCLSYNIDRLVIDHTIQPDFSKVDYVWANNKWWIDFPMNEESFNIIKNSNELVIVYDNTNTKTTIYKVI